MAGYPRASRDVPRPPQPFLGPEEQAKSWTTEIRRNLVSPRMEDNASAEVLAGMDDGIVAWLEMRKGFWTGHTEWGLDGG